MRLKLPRLSGLRKPWAFSTISLSWLLAAFFLTCHASQYLLAQSIPGAEAWLALSPAGMQHGYIWQLLTHTLVNSSLWQLCASVIPFVVFANELEPIFGPRHLAGAFLFTLLPAGATSLWWPAEGGQMGIWPGVCGLLTVLGTMLPMLEFRYRLLHWPIIIRLRLLACLLPIILVCAILAGWVTHTSLVTLPPAMLIGYLYARGLGYGLPTRAERFLYERQLQQKRWERMPPRLFVEQEVDPILEKINRLGIKSVTRREKKILKFSANAFRDSITR